MVSNWLGSSWTAPVYGGEEGGRKIVPSQRWGKILCQPRAPNRIQRHNTQLVGVCNKFSSLALQTVIRVKRKKRSTHRAPPSETKLHCNEQLHAIKHTSTTTDIFPSQITSATMSYDISISAKGKEMFSICLVYSYTQSLLRSREIKTKIA